MKITLKDYLNEKYNIGDILTSKQMIDYIFDNKLRNSFGLIKDYNDVKDIAYSSDLWKLEYVNLNNFDWIADKDFKNKSIKFHPIVLKQNNKYEVLDGKHRIGMLKNMNVEKMLMWVGY
jgi:hypothetical protein